MSQNNKMPFLSAREAVSNRWRNIDYSNSKGINSLKDKTMHNSATAPTIITNANDNYNELVNSDRIIIDLTTDTSDKEEEHNNKIDKSDHNSSTTETFIPKKINNNNNNNNSWCFKLIKSEIYDTSNNMFAEPVISRHFITLDDILYDCNLEKTILFSFQYELNFILPKIYHKVNNVTIIAQTGTIIPLTINLYTPMMKKTHIIEFQMPPYSCHHSKMIINFYKDQSCRIFLPSNNFTYNETNFPQQVCWCSPVLSPINQTYQNNQKHVNKKNKFQKNLIKYLNSYNIKDIKYRSIINDLQIIDFSPLNDNEISFIFSTTNKKVTSGLKLLNDILLEKSLLIDNNNTDNSISKHLLCQTSSMGNSLSRNKPINIFTHLMIPTWYNLLKINENDKRIKYIETETLLKLYEDMKLHPYIVYPTLNELKNSMYGMMIEGWFNFYYERNIPYYSMLKEKFKIFYKQSPRNASFRRGPIPAHSKFYLSTTTTATWEANKGIEDSPFQELDWCCYTSANLSMNAWGKILTSPRNYEVGVLIHKSKINKDKKVPCLSFTDLVYSRDPKKKSVDTDGSIIVPFTLPLLPYDEGITGDECYNRAIHATQLQ